MKSKINIREKSNDISEYFFPRVIGELDDVYVKLAKIMGDELPWHHHEGEDELFYIIEGRLLLEIEGKEAFWMEKGDLFIVKKGITHRVSSVEECRIMLIEKKTTEHTGELQIGLTKSINEQLHG